MPFGIKKLSRRRFVAGTLGGGLGGLAYMKCVEPRWLAVGQHQVRFPGTTAGQAPIRLLHLSDFHASEEVSLEFISTAVRQGLALKPDLICLTGDFITWRYEGFS